MKAGSNVSYHCNLENINKITQLDIPELGFHRKDESGLTQSLLVNNRTMLIIDTLEDHKIQLLFEEVDCYNEGAFTIKINNGISDVVELMLIGILFSLMSSWLNILHFIHT